MRLLPDDEERVAHGFLVWLAAIIATIAIVGLMAMTCGCSGSKAKPVIGPPAVVEVVKLVPVPCPIPQLPPETQPLLPLVDVETAPVKTLMEALRIDYLQLWLEAKQLRDLLMIYVQQAEVRNAEVTP